MKGIILGAGYGTRLRPLTLDQPKPLLGVAGKAIIEHILEKIRHIPGVEDVLVVTNSRYSDRFEDWKKGFQWTRPIEIINDGTTSNENRLGAVGDVYFALEKKGIQEEVLVVGGDNLFEFDLNKAMAFFREKGCSVIGLYDMGDKAKVARLYGVVSIDGDSRIVGFEEKPENPKTSLISTAIYFFTKEDVGVLRRYIKEGNRADNLGDFIRYLSSNRIIYGYVFREKWFDIGNYEQYQNANVYFSRSSGG
jgi:glucose-1-phosphate thymidylyltransferase